MKTFSFLMTLFLFIWNAHSTYAQTSTQTQVIQNGTENLILAQLLGSANIPLSIYQAGNNNTFVASEGKHVLSVQKGNQNSIFLHNKNANPEAQLSIQQQGNNNTITSFGTNAIVESSTIIQQGNSMQLTLINE